MASAHGTGDHIISVQPEANGLSHVQPDYGWVVPLIKAMERGDWACFKTQLDLDSSVKSRRINSRGDTFLHLAIRDTGNVQFVRELVKEMSQEELELKNEMEGHALISAATGGIKEIAEIMLEKNSNLAGIPSGNGLLPIIIAVRNGDKDVAEYLYSKTPLEQLDPEKMENGSRVVTDGARLVRAAIISDMYGIALKLVQQYPKLVIACEDRRWNAAIILAGRPCAFPSGCRHQFLEGLVYKGVSLLSGIQQETDNGYHGNKAQLSRMNQVMNVLRGFFWKGIKHISDSEVLPHSKQSTKKPLPRMRYELKLYVTQHNLVEFGEPLEELLLSYNISDDMEQVHISENCSQIPGETTQSSEGIHSSISSIDGRKKIKPKSLSTENNQTSSVAKSANRWNHQRVFVSMEAMNRNASNSNNGLYVQVSETCSQIAGETTQSSEGVHNSSSSINGGKRLKPKSLGSENIRTSSVAKSANGGNRQRIFVSKVPVNKNDSKSDIVDFGCGLPKKKSRRPNRQVGKKENVKNQNQEEKIVGDKDPVELLPNGETEQDDKENKDAPQPEEICSSPEQVV